MSSRPRMLMCYLCGREYGTKSLPIHIPQCQRKWIAVEEQKPKKERRPLPPEPKMQLDEVVKGKGEYNIDAFNEQMYDTWETQSLITCPHCGRSFTDSAMKHHKKSCTAAKPAKPAGTGLTRQSLSMRVGPGPVAGTSHDMSHLKAAFDTGVSVKEAAKPKLKNGQLPSKANASASNLLRKRPEFDLSWE
ncbi:hypothetical protein CYMTET_38101 [Cymbomonas tetramitiformis]|uniref:Zinc finger protein 474 n=1 Tax=Cymbomonas tetramitiformis TaxID=36881 RepID=A0AAE0CCR5_9CHLO|nr:hypothetical protein CYMTET_38101 [Cymbomonas tetramitiformis]